jgi:hypothetical protein
MIAHLNETGLYDVSLISLDNDLELIDDGSGQLIDPGDGVEVARWLTKQPSVVPVVVHTTNMPAGDEIMSLLENGGWVRERIVPYDGETWIAETWRSTVRDLVVKYAPNWSVSGLGVHILKNGLIRSVPWEEILTEVLKAASTVLCGSQCSDSLCLEVAHLGDNSLCRTAGTGFSVLRTVGAGAASEIVDDSARAVGIGSINISDPKLGLNFRQFLAEEGVHRVQIDVIQPKPGFQAIFMIAVKGAAIQPQSHRVQSILIETWALLELALISSLRDSPATDSMSEHQRVSR